MHSPLNCAPGGAFSNPCKSMQVRNPAVSYNLIVLAFQVYLMFSVIDFDNNDKLYFSNICIERDTI